MKIYFWDAGVAIGYVMWTGEPNGIIGLLDSLAENCDRFVHTTAINSENFLSGNAHHEIMNRNKKNICTFQALIEMVRTGKLTPNPEIDMERLFSLKEKFSTLDKVEVLEDLIKIQSHMYSRWLQLKKCCKFQKYHKRLPAKDEKLMEEKLNKRGDLLNYSAAAHYSTHEGACFFITTDWADFGNLDLSDLGLPHKFPGIEFVQDY